MSQRNVKTSLVTQRLWSEVLCLSKWNRQSDQAGTINGRAIQRLNAYNMDYFWTAALMELRLIAYMEMFWLCHLHNYILKLRFWQGQHIKLNLFSLIFHLACNKQFSIQISEIQNVEFFIIFPERKHKWLNKMCIFYRLDWYSLP